MRSARSGRQSPPISCKLPLASSRHIPCWVPLARGTFGPAEAGQPPCLDPMSVLPALKSSRSVLLPFSRAIQGNARREPWELWYSWQRGNCELQIRGTCRGLESHPHPALKAGALPASGNQWNHRFTIGQGSATEFVAGPDLPLSNRLPTSAGRNSLILRLWSFVTVSNPASRFVTVLPRSRPSDSATGVFRTARTSDFTVVLT